MANSPHGTITPDTANDLDFREVLVAGGAGFAGMVAMIPFFAVAFLLGALSPEAFAGLAELLSIPANSPLAFPIGAFIFIGGGMTTLPLLFISLAEFLPPKRSIPLRGVTYAIIIWTGFSIAFWTGQGGLQLATYLVITLLAHMAYGYVVGWLFSRFEDLPKYKV